MNADVAERTEALRYYIKPKIAMAQERYTNLKVHGEPRETPWEGIVPDNQAFVTAECGQTKVETLLLNSFLYILYIQKKHCRDTVSAKSFHHRHRST